MPRQSALRLLVLACLLTNCGSSFAQRRFAMRNSRWRSAQNWQQKERERVQELLQARRQLTQQEMAAISEATAQLSAAKRAHRQAGKELTAAREKALQEIEDSLGLKNLRDDLAAAQAEFKTAATPVLEQLKATDEYLAAEKKAAAAKLEIQQLHADSEISEAEKKAKLAELFVRSTATTNLEQLALRKDPAASRLHDRVEAAQSKVAEVRNKAIEKAEKNSTVSAAQQAVESAYAQVKSAEANLAGLQVKAGIAEQLLQAGIVPKKSSPSGGGKNDGKGGKKS
ncbi:MAG TPA: hypothetical protein VM510_12045 [Caulifigura sp.]|jgi:hypothetical protein|nr:hypothetical protein [Caulifigura sp.]